MYYLFSLTTYKNKTTITQFLNKMHINRGRGGGPNLYTGEIHF